MPQIHVYLSEDNQSVHDLVDDSVSIGRLPDNTIQIEDASVSSHHAVLVAEADGYRLNDNGSTNGTFVNGAATTSILLKNGDRVKFGSIETLFADEQSESASQLPPVSERAAVAIGAASKRPGNFVNASPFPKPAEKPDALTYAAIGLAVLGALGFLASVALSFGISAA